MRVVESTNASCVGASQTTHSCTAVSGQCKPKSRSIFHPSGFDLKRHLDDLDRLVRECEPKVLVLDSLCFSRLPRRHRRI